MSPEGNRGIFVDIFPIYNVPDDDAVFAKQVKKLKKIREIYSCYQIDRAIKKFGVKKLYSIFTSPEKLCRQYMEISNMEKNRTKRVSVISFDPGNKKLIWDSKWFENTIELPFEDIKMPCPECYDEILTSQFGDWHQFVKGTSLHSSLNFSTEIDYRDYLKNRKADSK